MTFQEAVKLEGQKDSMNIDDMISLMKSKQKETNLKFDMEIGQLNMAKLQQDAENALVGRQEKMQKLQTDAASNMAKQDGPVAIGGNMLGQFIPEETPEAVGLPLLEGIQ